MPALLLRVLAVLVVLPCVLAAQQFDLVIRGGRLMDGSGNPWRYGDVGVRGDRIVAVGRLDGTQAQRVIDATGKVVTPGFIDLHSHADDPNYGPNGLRSRDVRRRAAANLVMQGITTVVVNADGRSVWPIRDQRRELTASGTGPNVVLMVGHGTVRERVMGTEVRRPATQAEIAQMRALVRQGMAEGAWGLTAGLEYAPGRWSETDEVVALVEEIVPFDGVYIAHERSEGADPMWYWPSQEAARPPSLIDAVLETIAIGERTGARVVASHIKAKGAHFWGSSAVAIRLINEARTRGVQVYADQYPYNTTGSDGETVLLPPWALAAARGGARRGQGPRDFAAGLREILAQDSLARRLRQDVAHEIARRGGAENIVVFRYPDSTYVGRSLEELARARGVAPVEMAIRLQLEGFPSEPGGALLRGFSLAEVDIEAYAAQEWTATATDGWVALPEDGFTHVRVYGSYPRKIQHYALERGLLSVEDAVRSATSLPAEILGMADRGWLRPGYAADIVILDLATLKDNATFFDPHRYPSGVVYVFINGQAVVEDGRPTLALPGKVLDRGSRPDAGR